MPFLHKYKKTKTHAPFTTTTANVPGKSSQASTYYVCSSILTCAYMFFCSLVRKFNPLERAYGAQTKKEHR